MVRATNEADIYLLAELKNGNEGAFDFIFRKFYKTLTAQAYTFVRDVDLAQGLVQDCFVKFWERREKSEGIKNLPAYLGNMVRNRCVDHLRQAKSRKLYHSELRVDEEDKSTEEQISFSEFEEQLVLVLQTLPERTRIAFEYSRFENLSYKEIAEKMDISVKAVEALISRALKILREDLKHYLPLLTVFF